MGEHYSYFPQDHYSDRPGAPPTGRRINVIAGLTRRRSNPHRPSRHPPPPRRLSNIQPQPVAVGNVQLHGLCYGDRTIDLDLAPNSCEVQVDGRPVAPGPDGTILAVPPRT